MRLTLLAALGVGALGMLAQGGTSVVHMFVVVRAVEARAGIVAALRSLANVPRALGRSGFLDQCVTVGTAEGAAFFLQGVKRIVIGRDWRPSLMLQVRSDSNLIYGLTSHRLEIFTHRVKPITPATSWEVMLIPTGTLPTLYCTSDAIVGGIPKFSLPRFAARSSGSVLRS